MNEDSDFPSFFNSRVKDAGLNLKRLSELSGIALNHLEAMSLGDFSAMPPAPYFRGYLIKLGSILDFEPDEWWRKIKTSSLIKNSGAADAPPSNRFIKPQFLKYIWIAGVALVVLVYFVLQFPKISGKPDLRLAYPDKNPAISTSSTATIRGTISNWNELTLNNGETISVNQDGTWEKIVLLSPGLNTFEVKAKKFLGGEVKIIEQIIYQATSTTTGGI